MTEIDSSKKFNRSAYLYTPNISTGYPAKFTEMGFNAADLHKTILDVGCGCTGQALEHGDSIFGIDPNLGQYALNGKMLNSNMKAAVPERSARALAEELPFKNESFDIAYSAKAVGFYPRNINVEMAIREMLRVVKKQTGIICFNWGQEMTARELNPLLEKLKTEGYGISHNSNWIYIFHPEFIHEN